jgi:3-deoxy-manno-octulosonate cytidylyltransferase (CMP-KDO synthetase)
VVIATDDVRIKDAVESFGGEAIMTSNAHPSGTDRVAEVAAMLPKYDVIVNLQGDEPEMDPQAVNLLIDIQQTTNAFMSTLCCEFSKEQYLNCQLPSCTKVVLGKAKSIANDLEVRQALYFSRSLIPYYRSNGQDLDEHNRYFLHIGMYAYSRESLAAYVKLAQGELEQIECLEQLRVLENGYQVLCGTVATSHVGIDTLDEYKKFVIRNQLR